MFSLYVRNQNLNDDADDDDNGVHNKYYGDKSIYK